MIAQYHPPPGQSDETPVKLTNPAGAGSDPPPPPLHWKQTGPPPTSTRACQTCRQQITSSKKPPFADFQCFCWFFGHMWHVTNKFPLAKPPRGLTKPVLLLILTLAEFVQKPLLHWLTAVLAGFYFDSLAGVLISWKSPALSRTMPKDGKLPWNG